MVHQCVSATGKASALEKLQSFNAVDYLESMPRSRLDIAWLFQRISPGPPTTGNSHRLTVQHNSAFAVLRNSLLLFP